MEPLSAAFKELQEGQSQRTWVHLWGRVIAAGLGLFFLSWTSEDYSYGLYEIVLLATRGAFSLFTTILVIEGMKRACYRWGNQARASDGKMKLRGLLPVSWTVT